MNDIYLSSRDLRPCKPISVNDFNNLKSIEDLQKYMTNIDYGWIDINGVKHIGDDDMFVKHYMLQSPQDLIKNKIGVCWDQVELERLFFHNNNFSCETYFMIYYNEKDCPTHTFLIYNQNHNWYWLENSWEIYRGLHDYKSKELLLDDVKHKFLGSLDEKLIEDSRLYLYKYSTPTYGIDVTSFYQHCEKGEQI